MTFTEDLAANLLEISSEQRLKIVILLAEDTLKLSDIAKKLDSTASEIHRNLNRLVDSQLIIKTIDGNYTLTTFGMMIYSQINSWDFFISNKDFFTKHSFGNVPDHFLLSMGQLSASQHIKGYVKVQECWTNIYKNASKYIFNMLHEVSYEVDTVNILKEKIQSGISLQTIFSNDAIIPDQRKEVLEKTNFKDVINAENVQRKIGKNLSVFVVLNETESNIAFPTTDGDVDVSQIFYSKDKQFHEWCLKFFKHNWESSSTFNAEITLQYYLR